LRFDAVSVSVPLAGQREVPAIVQTVNAPWCVRKLTGADGLGCVAADPLRSTTSAVRVIGWAVGLVHARASGWPRCSQPCRATGL
jgi:hypothetical protein